MAPLPDCVPPPLREGGAECVAAVGEVLAESAGEAEKSAEAEAGAEAVALAEGAVERDSGSDGAAEREG